VDDGFSTVIPEKNDNLQPPHRGIKSEPRFTLRAILVE